MLSFQIQGEEAITASLAQLVPHCFFLIVLKKKILNMRLWKWHLLLPVDKSFMWINC